MKRVSQDAKLQALKAPCSTALRKELDQPARVSEDA
jgi:hypothetical protein